MSNSPVGILPPSIPILLPLHRRRLTLRLVKQHQLRKGIGGDDEEDDAPGFFAVVIFDGGPADAEADDQEPDPEGAVEGVVGVDDFHETAGPR